MRSAFGIKLEPTRNLDNQPMFDSDRVTFWKEDHGWCGVLRVGDFMIRETIGSASPSACYRSMRGRARNLARSLQKLGIKP
jgi:hypothetical protein